MSTIPKARRSNITGLTVTPDVWDSYPELSRSTIINCTFKNLGATTSISRSTMSDSSVLQEESLLSATAETTKSKAKNGTSIERSTVDKCQIISPSTVSRSQITNCTVVESTVDRGKLVNCTVSAQSNVDRTTAQTSRFVGAKLVRRSVLSDSVVMGESRVGRSAVNDSVVGDKAVIEQTALENAVITRSRVERSRISNCDVMDCEIQRTDFTGMILQYGIWKNGDLVGRTSTQHEVVIKPREKSASSKGVAEGLSTSSAEQPVQNPGSGWKAAEAAWEGLGVESDYEEDEEEGDSLSDNLEESGNDEPSNSSSKRKMKQSLHQNSGQDTSTAGSGADINDPPPPYEH